MLIRRFTSCAIVLGLLLIVTAPAFAEKSHEGMVVSVSEGSGNTDGKLVMTDGQGKGQHSHAIAAEVKTTRNGKSAKLGDLKKGDSITVTTDDDGNVTALTAETASDSKRSSDKSDSATDKNDLTDILKDIKLQPDQREKINDITRKYDADCESAWNEFSDVYRSAIRIEASMLAAVEDHFNDVQRKHLDKQRHRKAHKENRTRGDANDATADRDKSPGDESEEEIVIIGITLSPDQQRSARTTRKAYLERLSAAEEAIENLHVRMISLETEKLLEIEKVLTKEQRQQLRRDHQRITSASKDNTDDKSSK